MTVSSPKGKVSSASEGLGAPYGKLFEPCSTLLVLSYRPWNRNFSGLFILSFAVVFVKLVGLVAHVPNPVDALDLQVRDIPFRFLPPLPRPRLARCRSLLS